MIAENGRITPASINSSTAISPSPELDFKYFAAYAKFLLENKLDEFVITQFKFSKEVNIPLLKYFEHLTEVEFISIGMAQTKELLSNCADNMADEYIKTSVANWMNNQIPFISRNQIII